MSRPRKMLIVALEVEVTVFVSHEQRERFARGALARRLEDVARDVRSGQTAAVYGSRDDAAGAFLLNEINENEEETPCT